MSYKEIYNVSVVSNQEVLAAFNDGLENISYANLVCNCLTLTELLNYTESDLDVVYIDLTIASEEDQAVFFEFCRKRYIEYIEIIKPYSSDDPEIEPDFSRLEFPFDHKTLITTLYVSIIKLDSTLKHIKDKRQTESIMIGLANSNVRVILLSEALQKLRVAENIISKKGGFLSYICDFSSNLISIAQAEKAFFVVYDEHGAVKKLYDNQEKITNLDQYQDHLYLSDEIYASCINSTESYSEDRQNISFDFDENNINKQMVGKPIFVNKKLYGAVIAIFVAGENESDKLSNENSISILCAELEKSLERVVLDRRISRKNKELHEMNSRFDFLLKSSPAVLFNLSVKNKMTFEFVSENIQRLTGYSAREFVKNDGLFESIINEEDLDNAKEQLTKLAIKKSCIREYRINTKFGKSIWVHDEIIAHFNSDGKMSDIVGYLVDIDSQVKAQIQLTNKNKELEEANQNIKLAKDQLLQSEKLASIGQLAAGIAHEINNPVGYISSNISSMDDYVKDLITVIDSVRLPLDEGNYSEISQKTTELKQQVDYEFLKNDISQLVEQSLDGVRRVKQIVQDLKDFSHVDEEDWIMGDIHKGIDSTLNIVNNEVKYKAEIVKDYGELPEIECIPSQLNQVFMNLLVNAAHAIDENGKIIIQTRQHADKVVISIIDNGHGISEDNLSKLFDPFFTTKPVGEGTGLGLSLSYGIVERHKGRIVVDSKIGVGTTFSIELPITQTQQQIAI